jgi:hypothetical protein
MLVLSVCAGAQTGPLSLDRLSRQKPLYMLDESGRILVAERTQIDAPTRILVRMPSTIKGLDILATKLWDDDRELLFVTAYGLTEDDSRSRIIEYLAAGQEQEGKKQCEWILPEISAGLDVDAKNRVVYLSGSSTGTVYKL